MIPFSRRWSLLSGVLTATAVFAFPPIVETSATTEATGAPVSGTWELTTRDGGLNDVSNKAADGAIAAPAQGFDDERNTFWAWDYELEVYYQVEATLRHASPRCLVYVEDSRDVSGAAIRELAEVFEDTVHPRLRGLYGTEPDPGIDGRSPVTLLLLDIRDPLHHGQPPHTYISGYFDPANQYLQSDLDLELPGRRSNQREMLYLDVAPTDPRGDIIRQTLAHEFAHLIQWNYDPEEDGWLTEALCELAVHLTGMGHPRAHVEGFLADPEVPLTTWDGQVRDYGKVYLFMLYAFEQIDQGSVWLRDLVANPKHGMDALGVHLPADRTIDELYRDFALALHLDVPNPGNGRYQFLAVDLDGSSGSNGFPRAARHVWRHFPVDAERVEVAPWTIRGDVFRPGPGAIDFEMTPSASTCVGAGWQPPRDYEPDEWQVVADCTEPMRPVLWQIPDYHTNAFAAEVYSVVANVLDEPLSVTLSAIPPAGVESPPPTVYLPLTINR